MRFLCVCACALTLIGCTASPSVNYHILSDKDYDDSWIPYQLTDTTLVIGINVAASNVPPGSTPTPKNTGQNKTAKGRAPAAEQQTASSDDTSSNSTGPAAPKAGSNTLIQPLSHSELRPVSLVPRVVKCLGSGCYGDTVSMAAVPISYEGETFGIEPTRNWFIYTYIAPVYVPNSFRLQSLEVSVQDKRQEVIETIGALVVGSAKTFGSGGATARALEKPVQQDLLLPIVVDLAEAKKAEDEALTLPNNPGWTYKLKFLDDPVKTGFKPRSDITDIHDAAVTSLCRPVAVTLFGPEDKTTLVLGTTVADPDYIAAIPLPPTGSVDYGTVCGANVSMTAAPSLKLNEVVATFFNDVQATREALSGAPSKRAPPSKPSSSPKPASATPPK